MTQTFLIAHDYGMGGVWAYVRAASPDEIQARFLEVTVYESPPEWMDEALRARIEARGVWDVETLEQHRPAFARLLRPRA
jgi:Trk K+ transport system NAD-binding subunit